MPKIALFLLIFAVIPAHAQEYSVNGYGRTPDSDPLKFNRGLRLKGFGDFLFNKGSFAQAVPYYQQALELIPTESDASFKLGRIYHQEKIYRLAELYYQQSIADFQKPENYTKTQLTAYVARVRLAEVYHEQGMRAKALEVLAGLRREEGLLKSLYTPAWDLLENNLGQIYPMEAVLMRPGATPRTRAGQGNALPDVEAMP